MIFFALVSLITLFTQVSHADTVTTPFNLELSAQSSLALLGGIALFKTPSGEFKTDLPDQNQTVPYAVSVTGLHLDLNYAFNPPVENGTLAKYALHSQSITADLFVDKIDASQTIVQTSGGTTLNVVLKASCTNVHLALLPNSTSVDALVGLSLIGGKASFTLNSFQANWMPSAWQIVSLDCQGPEGFTQLVKQNITTQLSSIDPFLSAIQTQIQAGLDSAATSVTDLNMVSNDSSGTSLRLQPERLVLLPNGGASLSGQASFGFAKLNLTACQSSVSTQPKLPTSSDVLAVPVEVIPQILKCAYLNGSLATSFTSEEFTAFKSLLGNWFAKLFVFPNLVHYNRNSIFRFDVALTSAPQFGTITSDDNGDINFDISVPVTLTSFAPGGVNTNVPSSIADVPNRNDGYEHYVNFFTELSGPATLSVQNGAISFYQQNIDLDLSSEWDADYLANHHPDQRIWRKVLQGQFSKFLANTGLQYPLPILQVPGAFTLQIQSASINGTDLDIALDIKKLTSQAE